MVECRREVDNLMNRRIAVLVAAFILIFGMGAGYAVATDVSRTDSTLSSLSFTRHVENELITGVSGVHLRSMDINCPSGEKSIGGGGYIEDSNQNVMPMFGSYPGGESNWVVYFNDTGFTSPYNGYVFVICVTT